MNFKPENFFRHIFKRQIHMETEFVLTRQLNRKKWFNNHKIYLNLKRKLSFVVQRSTFLDVIKWGQESNPQKFDVSYEDGIPEKWDSVSWKDPEPKTIGKPRTLWRPRTLWGPRIIWGPRTLWETGPYEDLGPYEDSGPMMTQDPMRTHNSDDPGKTQELIN